MLQVKNIPGYCAVVAIAGLAFSQTYVQAATEVSFSNRELNASMVLMRPQLNTIEIVGHTGEFEPAPSLKLLGVEHEEFNVDLSWLGDVIGVEFNHLKSGAPSLLFETNGLKLVFPIQDSEHVIRCRLGSISVEGVSLVAMLSWRLNPDGTQDLILSEKDVIGNIYGTGVLRNEFILNRTKIFLMNLLARKVVQILDKPEVQKGIQKGLLGWSRFYLGEDNKTIVRRSLQFYNKGVGGSGLSYQVE